MSPQTNIDEEELAKFTHLADTWWDEEGELRTLHHINPTRLSYITRHIELANKRLLDIGCGGGILSEALANAEAKVTAIDANPSAIAVAKVHRGEQSPAIDYQIATAEEFSERYENEFQIITCMELLEHVPDVDSLLAACSKLLKPDGIIFLSTVNRTLKSYLSAIVAAEYVLNLLPRGTHDYEKFLKPAELAVSLRRSHFKVLDITGMSYIPGIQKSSLMNDPSVNYLVTAQRIT